MTSVHMLAYSQNKVEQEYWHCSELWSVSHDHTSVCPNSHWVSIPAPRATQHSSTLEWRLPCEESAQLWTIEPAQNWCSILTGWGQPLLVFMGAAYQDQSGTLVHWDHPSMSPDPHKGADLAPLAPQCSSPLRQSCHCWEVCTFVGDGAGSDTT